MYSPHYQPKIGDVQEVIADGILHAARDLATNGAQRHTAAHTAVVAYIITGLGFRVSHTADVGCIITGLGFRV